MEFIKEEKEKIMFTNHILERFVERTMNKTGLEVKQFLAQNEEQIKQKILKLYEYSEMFWYGKIKEHDFTYFLINKDGWVIIIDKDKKTLITMYKVDLGLSSEFNKQYISEIKNYVEKELASISDHKIVLQGDIAATNSAIEATKDEIKNLKSQIAIFENQIKIWEQEIKNETDSINLQEKQLQQKIEKFIGAKIFEK